jgi:hypothetical protein
MFGVIFAQMIRNAFNSTYATYSYQARRADTARILSYGDLEIELRNQEYYFSGNPRATLANIGQIKFRNFTLDDDFLSSLIRDLSGKVDLVFDSTRYRSQIKNAGSDIEMDVVDRVAGTQINWFCN